MYNRHCPYFQLFLRFIRELSGTLIDRNNKVGGLSNWFIVICKTFQVFLKQYETRISSRSSHAHLSTISHPSLTNFSPISHLSLINFSSIQTRSFSHHKLASKAGLKSSQVTSSHLKSIHCGLKTEFNFSLVCYTVHIQLNNYLKKL